MEATTLIVIVSPILSLCTKHYAVNFEHDEKNNMGFAFIKFTE